MKKDGWRDYPFSFHDSEELGPAILAKISKLRPLTVPRFSSGKHTISPYSQAPATLDRPLADDRIAMQTKIRSEGMCGGTSR